MSNTCFVTARHVNRVAALTCRPGELRCSEVAYTLLQYLGGAGAVEGVSLQNVSTSLQEVIVDVSNDIRASYDQQVVVASQFIRMTLVTFSSEVLLCQPDGHEHVSLW